MLGVIDFFAIVWSSFTLCLYYSGTVPQSQQLFLINHPNFQFIYFDMTIITLTNSKSQPVLLRFLTHFLTQLNNKNIAKNAYIPSI